MQPRRLNLMALAQGGQALAGSTSITEFPRLAADVPADAPPPEPVSWEALAELRPKPGAPDELWLHLRVEAAVPLSCQRCLAPVTERLDVDRWFRFVESEDVALAEDDEAEEDLLVLEPQFDLLALVEDELLMSLPLVPMHEQCPEAPALKSDQADLPEEVRPNPFAALAQLKKKPH